MPNTIHFSEAHKKKFLEGFANRSETDALFSHDLDIEFSGVKTVHVKSVKTEEMQDYDRSKVVGTGSRYGTTTEVGDEEQTFTMTQDKSLSLSIDKGNNAEQFNMKAAGKVMNAHRNERIIPAVDTYRLNKWAAEAGIHKVLTAAPTKSTIAEQIIDLHNDMLDAGVPDSGVTLLIPRTQLKYLKLADEWVKLDSLGGKTLPKGCIAEFDGMPVKPVTSKRFPAGAAFMLLYKGSVIAPVKINDFKGHVDPPGLSGDLLEFRMMYDAFVLGKKCDGVGVACLPGTAADAPTVAISTGKATVTVGTGETAYYTLDGSDPRYSVEKKAYTSAVTIADGETIRVYAAADGKWNSAVVSATA